MRSSNVKSERLHRIWLAMRNRCNNPRTPRYSDYGGRGIVVCDEWDSYSVFENWAMSHGYTDELTIDRIDNNESYSPENCRWSTVKEQNRNTRKNHLISFNGETHCISEWAEITGLSSVCIQNRIRYGWSINDILTKPKGYNVGINKTRPCKAVICEELNEEFESVKQAAELLHINQESIRKVCNRKWKTAGGYRWHYK